MLGWRLLVSAIVIPLLAAGFYLDAQAGPSAPFLLVLALLVAGRGVWELAALLQNSGFEPDRFVTSLCTLGVIGANWVVRFDNAGLVMPEPMEALGPVLLVFAVSILVLFLGRIVRFRSGGRNLETLAVELLILCYIGVLLSLTIELRWVAGEAAGYLALGSLIVVAKCGDIGAYGFGRLWGRRKLAPHLSPGKTWMGALGAVLASALAAMVWFLLVAPLWNPEWTPAGWTRILLFGVFVGTAGLVGDLGESLIKRDLEAKDAASLLPGFGGVLDLLDSVLYAGPVAFMLWFLWPPVIGL